MQQLTEVPQPFQAQTDPTTMNTSCATLCHYNASTMIAVEKVHVNLQNQNYRHI